MTDLIELSFDIKDCSDELTKALLELDPEEIPSNVNDQFFYLDENKEKQPKLVMRLIPKIKINHNEINAYFDFWHFMNTFNFIDKNFYPFNCSCGTPACAGIWNPIDISLSNDKITFNIPENSGYNFLDKNTFIFDLNQYKEELNKGAKTLKEQLNYMESKEDLIVTLDNTFDFYESIKDVLLDLKIK